MNEITDAELVVRTRRGDDTNAFGSLVIRHQGMVFAVAHALLEGATEVEDMAQEAFLRAYINLHTLKDSEKFAPWLRRIVVRCCRKWLNAYRPDLFRSVALSGEEDAWDAIADNRSPDPIDRLLEQERSQLVITAIARLSPRYRLPVMLFYLEGLPLRCIAEELNAPTGTVKSLISRARNQLQPLLESYITEATPMLTHLTTEHTLPDDFHHRIEWLTAALRRSGILQQGTVAVIDDLTPVDAHVVPGYYTTIKKLALQYTPDAPSSAPKKMFLKIQKDHEGKGEIDFYQYAACDLSRLPMMPRCYGAEYSEATGLSYCLVEDMSDTHFFVADRESIIEKGAAAFTVRQLEQMVAAVAGFHAYWWEDERLGQEAIPVAHPFRSQELYTRENEKQKQWWRDFVRIAGKDIPVEWRDLYEHALNRLPALWPRHFRDRFTHRKNITLISGDRYLNQFLCPEDATAPMAAMLDIHSVWTNLGADELWFMLISFFTPEQRRAGDLEHRLLRHYHEGLKVGGVRDYSWEELRRDYRVKAVWRVFHPVWDGAHGSDKAYWAPKMRCAIGAYEDLRCAELLDE